MLNCSLPSSTQLRKFVQNYRLQLSSNSCVGRKNKKKTKQGFDITSYGWGRKKIVNACSGLPTHGHNYPKMLEFANKNFFKIISPYCTVYVIL
jgi:hypothetical protein